MGDLEGIQTIKEDKGKKWDGKVQVRDPMQIWERQQELRKVGKKWVERDQPWEEGRCSRQNEAFKPGKTIPLGSHSQLFTFITPQGKRHKGIYWKCQQWLISWGKLTTHHWKALEKMSKHFLKSHNTHVYTICQHKENQGEEEMKASRKEKF